MANGRPMAKQPEIFNFAAADPKKPKYVSICWHQCYWLNHHWKPGDIYHGDVEPGKYFSKDGQGPEVTETAADLAVDDVRSTVELKNIAKYKYGIEINDSMRRKEIHALVRQAEKQSSRSVSRETKPADEPAEKPLKNMSVAELMAKAEELGIMVPPDTHHFTVRKMIREHLDGITG